MGIEASKSRVYDTLLYLYARGDNEIKAGRTHFNEIKARRNLFNDSGKVDARLVLGCSAALIVAGAVVALYLATPEGVE